MKKLGTLFFWAVAAVSCFDHHDDDYPLYATLATLEVPDTPAGAFHFVLDNGETLYPGDLSRINAYDPTGCDGQRAVLYFNLLAFPAPGYDYNTTLYRIEPVPTGTIATAATNDEAAACGNDPLELVNAWMSGGWLNLLCNLPLPDAAGRPHRLTVVENRTAPPPAEMPAGYRCFEIRYVHEGAVCATEGQYFSYALGPYDPARTGAKGWWLRYRSAANRIEYFPVDFPDTHP